MRIVSLLAFTAIFAGCGEKKAPAAAAASTPASGGSGEITAEMPDTADAKDFAKGLVDVQVTSWSPKGSSDFLYNSLSFAGSGSWKADAVLKVGGEEAPCAESGKWKIDSTESSDIALLELNIEKTNCASRESGASQRLRMTLKKGGDYDIEFR